MRNVSQEDLDALNSLVQAGLIEVVCIDEFGEPCFRNASRFLAQHFVVSPARRRQPGRPPEQDRAQHLARRPEVPGGQPASRVPRGGWERADNRTKREKAKEARERGLSVAELRALERPAAILAAPTTHEVAFSLADAQAAVMERVKDKAQHRPTLDAILAGAVPLGHKTTGEDRFTTPAVLQAHAELNEALRGLADARIGAVADTVPLKAIDSKIAAIRKAQRAELQLKLFPDWPDDRRGFWRILLPTLLQPFRASEQKNRYCGTRSWQLWFVRSRWL